MRRCGINNTVEIKVSKRKASPRPANKNFTDAKGAAKWKPEIGGYKGLFGKGKRWDIIYVTSGVSNGREVRGLGNIEKQKKSNKSKGKRKSSNIECTSKISAADAHMLIIKRPVTSLFC